MKISEISIKRPIYVIVFFAVLTLLGYLGFRNLSAELMPKFTPPVINVQVVYPGASPQEVENSLTRKLENALSSMEGIDQIQSYSFEGMSMLFVSFKYGTDIDKSITKAQNLVASKMMELPRDILSPTINKVTVDDKPIISIAATSNLEATQFYDLMDKRILPDINGIKGVAKVSLFGGQSREIQVNLDMDKMRALGISPIQIQGAIRGSNLDFPTGSLKSSETSTIVRLSGKLQSVEEIKNLVIMTLPTGSQIRLKDVAEISDAIKDATSLARVNGQEALLINLLKQGDANAIDVSDMVRKRISELESEFADEGLKMVIAQDSTDFTRQSINSVLGDLVMIVVLVTLVMLFFLHSFRNALIVMAVVPISLISTFIGMQMLDFTLNLMSLLGLSLVVGVLVDDAIVVIENVYRHMEMGKNPVRATFDAMKEIGFVVISTTAVLIVVFLPVALTNTLVSDILRQFSVVIVISVVISLVAALTLIPMLTSRFGKIENISGRGIFKRILTGFEKMIENFSNWISRILEWSLSHKRWLGMIVIAVTIAVFSLFPLGYIGFEFLPSVDRGEFMVQMEMPKDISFEESNALVRRAEDWMRSQPDVKNVITTVGATSDNKQSARGTAYLAEMNIELVPDDQRDMETSQYITFIKQPLSDFLLDARIKIFNVALTGEASKAPVEYVISGTNTDTLMLFADRALGIMRKIPGTMQQELSVERGLPEISVNVNRDKMSALGLTMDNVGLTMQMAFQGNNTLKYTENNYEYDINIRADKAFRQQPADVENLTFVNSRGEKIRLGQFADVKLSTGPNKLERYNRNSSVTIRSQVLGTTAGDVSAQFLSDVEKISIPKGVKIEATGDLKSMSDSMSVLMGALLLSVVLIYLSMVVLYNNWVDPLVVMFSIPLSIVGAVLALALTNTPMSIYGMLGFVVLIGLVAKNAILLVDFAIEARKQGKTVDEALISAVKIRTRPILMTALSTIIGMLPVALSTGAGAELLNGMAWVIIGGMTLSTLLTLVVVPVVFKIFHSGKRKKQSIDIEKLMREY
ncbi:MAG: efflux RND transporter permease subunit [Prolixibacteraceae bacterium]|nr:efflux RND transporter permease subunit [Prolixibacteraceae bacterium]